MYRNEAREHLFHPFFTTKTHGTGLGLASSRAIAEAHDGSMGLENVARAAAPASRCACPLPPRTEENDVMTQPKETKRKPVVYIVDDDDGMRRALTVLMTTVGYQPVAFASPSEFLAKYDPTQPSCLVLDVRMPEMSGLEVQQHLNRGRFDAACHPGHRATATFRWLCRR